MHFYVIAFTPRQIFSELALIFQSNFSKISAWCSYKIVLIKKECIHMGRDWDGLVMLKEGVQ